MFEVLQAKPIEEGTIAAAFQPRGTRTSPIASRSPFLLTIQQHFKLTTLVQHLSSTPRPLPTTSNRIASRPAHSHTCNYYFQFTAIVICQPHSTAPTCPSIHLQQCPLTGTYRIASTLATHSLHIFTTATTRPHAIVLTCLLPFQSP